MVVERPPWMLGASWGWGWWESNDQGDVAIGLRNTTILSPMSTRTCATPQMYGPGALSADTNGYTGSEVPGVTPGCHANHPWSFHTGGSNVLFGDGSVRFVSYNASAIMPALATRAGQESVDTSLVN
jgi:prepilin-type processing-associated H-X9-DG protein